MEVGAGGRYQSTGSGHRVQDVLGLDGGLGRGDYICAADYDHLGNVDRISNDSRLLDAEVQAG